MPPVPRVVLLGGHVIDPANNIDDDLNVVIEFDKIKELTKETPEPQFFENVVDVTGCIVTPGLIDHHVHLYPLAEKIGLPGEGVLFSNGVTTAVDCGSSGALNYPKHHELHRNTLLDFKAYINVSSQGLTVEDVRPEAMDLGAMREVFAEYGDSLLGLKLRTSKEVVKDRGYEPLKKTLELADQLGVNIMVHTTDPPGPMDELLNMLRPGDVCTHMYMNKGSTILDETGHVSKAAWAARERGVIFEAADAQGHFGFSTARPAIAEGFLPDFIATDGTRNGMLKHPTTFNMAMQLGRYECMGMSFKKVLECCTVKPAQQMGYTDGKGTLTVGGKADVAVFKKHDRETAYGDRLYGAKDQELMIGHTIYEPVATVKNGMVVYRNVLY